MNAATPNVTVRRTRTILLLLAAMLLSHAARAAEWNLDQLLQSLAKVASGRASFVEKKYIALLDQPVESSGELLYTAPDRLEKRTVQPRRETMVVDGNTMTIERSGKKHTVQLTDYPELVGFIDSIRGTLSGDRKALERSFRIELKGRADNWTLLLWPSDIRMSRNVTNIRITGKREDMTSIEVVQTDGDRSVMSIERMQSR